MENFCIVIFEKSNKINRIIILLDLGNPSECMVNLM